LNTFTLLGLSLAVGVVVDDAIMVMENIFRHAEEGKPRVRAAREGTAEIAFAALSATLAVVAIFAPVIFMRGVIGKFFLQFGVTLSVAVLLSYLEAVTLAPARCAQFLNVSRERRGRLGALVDRAFARLAASYRRVLALGLRHPVTVLLCGALLFAAAVAVFWTLPSEFVPSQDQSRLLVRLQTAVGSDLSETNRLFQRAETFINARPEVARTMAAVGGFGGTGVNTGMMFITLRPPADRALTQSGFAAALRRELNSYPGCKAVVQDLSQQGFTAQRGFPVEFSVRGPDWDRLVALSAGLRQRLEATGLVQDLDSDYRVGMPELQLEPDRDRAADRGVALAEVASTLNVLVGGARVGKYSSGGRRIDVRMRLMKEQRSRPEDLDRLFVRGAGGAFIPLSAVTRRNEAPALQAVTRKDRERAISLFANVARGASQADALAAVEKIGASLPLGYRAVLGGASATYRESMGSLVFALVLGIAVAYMVLASQFNSFLHPITVLTILPLSVAGAAFTLLIFGKTLNIFSMIGLLLLMGIVKKNSIILVDYAGVKRREGLDACAAMLAAAPVRLRPILMTSASTMMAALPAALGLGPGSETRTPMALGVIGGLILSTALSLLVVPAFYVVADRVKTALAARLFAGAAPRPAATSSAGEASAS
ncbi:MAG: efflux RND transporter permease subunit, partial [Planctomycetes bacterium]|nr:efflux RND transporter permease subunit [Planctomycetota bacterium]